MTLESSKETVAVLYDIENAPFEMLNYTLDKARRYQPCRTIVISDWDAHPVQKRWDRLLRRPGFTFRQIDRTFYGKNSLDSALYDSAQILYQEGVRKFFIITTDSDFVRIADSLNRDEPSYIIGVGTEQASESLRHAYNEFFVYPPEKAEKKAEKEAEKKARKEAKAKKKAEKEEAAVKEPKTKKSGRKGRSNAEGKTEPVKQADTSKAVEPVKAADTSKSNDTSTAAKSSGNRKQKTTRKRGGKQERTAVKPAPKADIKPAEPVQQTPKPGKQPAKSDIKSVQPQNAAPKAVTPLVDDGSLTVRLPRSLRVRLEKQREHEGVSLDELVTYLLVQGLAHKE